MTASTPKTHMNTPNQIYISNRFPHEVLHGSDLIMQAIDHLLEIVEISVNSGCVILGLSLTAGHTCWALISAVEVKGHCIRILG